MFFWKMNGLFSKFCPKTCSKSVRSALYVPRGAICRKQVFLGRLIVCSLFSDFYRKAFGLSARKSAGLSKLHSTSPQEHFEEKIYQVFLDLERFFPKYWQKIGASLSELHCTCQTSHSKKTNGFRKANSLSFVFGSLVESFRYVGKKTSACLSKVHSILSQEKFKDKSLNNFLFVFSDFRRQLFELVADYLVATLSELPCKCPVESFGERNVNKYFSLFSDGELKIFGFLARRNWQVCRNCILLLCRNILRQNVNVLGFSGKWTDFSPNSAQKHAASLSEVHCTCPEEPFAENKCF